MRTRSQDFPNLHPIAALSEKRPLLASISDAELLDGFGFLDRCLLVEDFNGAHKHLHPRGVELVEDILRRRATRLKGSNNRYFS